MCDQVEPGSKNLSEPPLTLPDVALFWLTLWQCWPHYCQVTGAAGGAPGPDERTELPTEPEGRSPSVYWGVTRSPVIRGDGYLFVCDFGESVVRVIGETLARQINDEEMLLQKSRETCPDLICPFCLGETDFLNHLIPTAFLFRIVLVAWTKKWFNIK